MVRIFVSSGFASTYKNRILRRYICSKGVANKVQKALHTMGSDAGWVPMSIDVVEKANGVEFQVYSGSFRYMLGLPSHCIADVGSAFEALESGNQTVSWRGQGLVSQKIIVSGKANSKVVRCHLVISAIAIPMRWTTFKCERNKLILLGNALNAFANNTQI